jgi:type IV pilus assembly protein PilF
MEPALANLKKAIQYDSESYEANAMLALVYEELKRFDEAEEHYLHAIKTVSRDSHEYGAIHNNYAGFLCARGRLEEAGKNYRIAYEHTLYRTPEIALENGGICYQQNKDLVTAEGYFRLALKKNPRMPRSLFSMAQLSFDRQRYLQGRAFMQRYLEIQKKPDAKSLLLAVKLELALGDQKNAQKYADLLRERYPESSEVNMLVNLK